MIAEYRQIHYITAILLQIVSLSTLFLFPKPSVSPSMASFSAVNLKFQPTISSLHKIPQGNERLSSIVPLGWNKSRQPTLRTSRRLQICAAKKETVDKVIAIVKEKLALASDTEVTAESEFTTLGADSLDTVEIVMDLEEQFNINVDEDKAQDITTIQQAADVIESLLEKKA